MEAYIVGKMNVAQLRERLKELGLDSKGLKYDLIQRINAHYDKRLFDYLTIKTKVMKMKTMTKMIKMIIKMRRKMMKKMKIIRT